MNPSPTLFDIHLMNNQKFKPDLSFLVAFATWIWIITFILLILCSFNLEATLSLLIFSLLMQLALLPITLGSILLSPTASINLYLLPILLTSPYILIAILTFSIRKISKIKKLIILKNKLQTSPFSLHFRVLGWIFLFSPIICSLTLLLVQSLIYSKTFL